MAHQSDVTTHVDPYLSVVVTTRNDDHGGDPLKRLQAFVNCFDKQCRRTGLDAEVIIVEWNPPADRPKLDTLLRLPDPCFCRYRFIDVPPELHERLRYADVLPLFQMIAKNIGIRRARGRFVLATNIDIIFSNELVEAIASRQLQPRRLYRVDRHDIQPDFPVDAPLEDQMAYCASHQLRVHTRWGSSPVDPEGRPVCLTEDIVDGLGVRLGSGWHVRESAGGGRVYRWASDAAELLLDQTAAGIADDAVLHLDIESNPYDPASWVEVAACENGATIATTRVAGRIRVRVPLGTAAQAGPRRIELRVVKPHPEWRRQLPVFERRDAMFYRIYSATIAPAATAEPVGFEYPLGAWTNANLHSQLTANLTPDGLSVTSDPRKWSYCVRYGPVHAGRRGVYRFDLTCSITDGRVAVGVLSAGDRFWIPATVTQSDDGVHRRFEVAVDLQSNEECSLVVFNDHPDGDGVTRFVIHQLRGTCDLAHAIPDRHRRSRSTSLLERRAVAYAKWTARLRASRARARGAWKSAIADRLARLIVRTVGNGVRYRVARSSPEFQNLEQALRAADQQLRAIAPLQDVADIHRFLRERRPDNLHVNGCGDFQLMAREHWDELRGYPEFETFSMNIDGLFSYIADAAGITEQVFAMPIYHLEHEVGSGWSPEGRPSCGAGSPNAASHGSMHQPSTSGRPTCAGSSTP